MICDESWKIHDASLITEINNISFVVNDLKAQLQEKSIVVNESKQLLATMKGKINELKQLLAKFKGKIHVTTSEAPNLDSRIQSLDDENVLLAFKVSSFEKEREHLKLVYKNLYDSIKQTRGRVTYADASRSKNTKNDRIQRPSSRSKKNKVEAQLRTFKSSSNKNNFVSDCKINVKNVDVSNNSANVCLSSIAPNADTRMRYSIAKNSLIRAHINSYGHPFNNPNFAFIVEIVLWYLDFGYSKHMTGQRDKLINFVSMFIEGLGHNLFLVRQFCDSDLEVALRKHTCFVRNLDGVDLLSGSSGSNLYTILLNDMMKSSPICLLSKASKAKSWLWHRRLSDLNISTINQLAKEGIVKGLPKLKYTKDHLVYEDKMKRSLSSTSNSQNLAFLSSENTSITNEVSTASGNFKVNTAGETNSSSQVSSTPGADEVVCSFFAQQTTSPPLNNEDLQQIDQDDLEELAIRWHLAMLTVKVQRYIQKTGRNLDFKGKQPVTFDKSKVECYNYHRKGHFAKECKSGRKQGKRSYGDNGRRNATTNEPSSQALVAQDGLEGYD
ncbi:retrovirus-related pol polyprotein from transposon TNT 1-94 [Tanacetum coccineum]